MNSIPQAIIFDIGGVLIDIDLDICPRIWAEATGEDVEHVRAIFWDDQEYQPLERGEISLEQYRVSLVKKLGFEIAPDDFYRGWTGLYRGEIAGMSELQAQLARLVRMVCLSNTNAAHVETFTVQFAHLFEPFERNFFSNEMAMRKPDANIYSPVLDYLALPASSVVFIDDKPANVDTAEAAGMKGVRFENAQQLRNELIQMGLPL